MYSHGLAAITICEAYAMTHDPDLLQPAQLALNFIVYAQDPRGGGWRYKPKEPGDTSVVGWQLMALKSGAMGNLQVPQQTFRLANSFLESVSAPKSAACRAPITPPSSTPLLMEGTSLKPHVMPH